jgi:hypothetical protein
VAKSKHQNSKQERQWAEAKRRCRLSQEDIRMARELGLKPRSLIKNIPSPNQQCKLPVKQWIQELYEKKTGKTPAEKSHGAQPVKRSKHTANDPVPPHACADETALIENKDNSQQAIVVDWEDYTNETWNDNALWSLEQPLYREIREENRRTRRRQKGFRVAAEYVAQAFSEISGNFSFFAGSYMLDCAACRIYSVNGGMAFFPETRSFR